MDASTRLAVIRDLSVRHACCYWSTTPGQTWGELHEAAVYDATQREDIDVTDLSTHAVWEHLPETLVRTPILADPDAARLAMYEKDVRDIAESALDGSFDDAAIDRMVVGFAPMHGKEVADMAGDVEARIRAMRDA